MSDTIPPLSDAIPLSSLRAECTPTLAPARLPPTDPTAYHTTHIGELGDIVSMNDTDTLPKEILDQNPTIPTFNRVFKDFLP